MDKKYVLTALIYGLLGLSLGIAMASSKDHGQLVTHAHMLLLGFVTSFAYGVCHKLWLTNAPKLLAQLQFAAHQLGTAVLVVGLFLLYGQHVPEASLGPVMGIGSIVVLLGMALMTYMFIKANASAPDEAKAPPLGQSAV